jgi:hypothetical protein
MIFPYFPRFIENGDGQAAKKAKNPGKTRHGGRLRTRDRLTEGDRRTIFTGMVRGNACATHLQR